MRIMHICLAATFTDGMTYQDNMLSSQNALDGNEVLVVADCSQFSAGKVVEVEPAVSRLSTGVRLSRLPYVGWLPKSIARKLRIVRGLRAALELFHPDVILHHGILGLSLLEVYLYCRRRDAVKFFIDTHADSFNSGRNLLSLVFQHQVINRCLLRVVVNRVERILYITPDALDFAVRNYSPPPAKLEYYPLGGRLLSDLERTGRRLRIRTRYGISDDVMVFVHTGKLDASKLTVELLAAFGRLKHRDLRLLVIGSVADDISQEVERLASSDSRIVLTGWMTGEDLIDHLCASDCYVQPGTQSATLQVAICCGLPVIVRDYLSHVPLVNGNGMILKRADDLEGALASMIKSSENLQGMSRRSLEIASSLLDYRVLARRLQV